MANIWKRSFWKDATERAIWTAAQTAVTALGADQVNIISVDWLDVAGFAAFGAVLSLLKAVGAGAKNGTASTIDTRAAE